ncbi:MAG: EAL domain-containing protein [Sideroxydans sp.]|nr:EAL domain-containing protein [Sideroxydans sp.]
MNTAELNILVVEDDDFQRGVMVTMLNTLGVTSIRDAGNGKQAIDIIHDENTQPIDIVLCDLNMPEMDGLEFLRHLGHERRNVAIVIISALGGKLLLSAGKMAKMHGMKLLGVIEKPIMLGQLKELLEKYERTEAKWQQSSTGMNFDLQTILQGIRAKQFEPYFQPKVNLKTGRAVGAEALARWVHPEQGVVSPHHFIPLLEQSANIDELTFLMLEKSAVAAHALQEAGYSITISVNLSLVSLAAHTLADHITQIVREAKVDPSSIVLEITESAAMTDAAQALENLARLCMNGFTLSIDDYGTGYSSLQQLTRIPFNELKIDQSFVKDFSDNETSRIVVESSIDMAHKLQLKSVAEGVETQQDWDNLKAAGCEIAQGYFIARPMDLRAFHDFLAIYKSSTGTRGPA